MFRYFKYCSRLLCTVKTTNLNVPSHLCTVKTTHLNVPSHLCTVKTTHLNVPSHLCTVKTTHLNVPSHRFNKFLLLSSTSPKRNVSSSLCLLEDFKVTDAERDNFNKLFKESNKDKDGFISEEEIRQIYKKLLPWVNDRLIDHAFKNKKTLNKCPYEVCFHALDVFDDLKQASDEVADMIFKELGAKPDGKVSIEDAAAFTNKIGFGAKGKMQKELRKSMKTYDKDGDGSLTLQELREWDLYESPFIKVPKKKPKKKLH